MQEAGKPSTVTRQLGSGVPLRFGQALPNQSSRVDDATFESLHRALAPRIGGSDLFPQLFDDGQQLSVFALAYEPTVESIERKVWNLGLLRNL